MWEPVRIGREVHAVVAAVAPDQIIVDHLAFSARLALMAGGIRHADVVVGHPSALPVAGEVYGFPPVWPSAFRPEPGELGDLRELCDRVSDSFTAEWNSALAELNPASAPSTSAFAEHGDVVLYNYPAELADPEREPLLPAHLFIGSAVRDEPFDVDVAEWIAATDEAFVYVSFGSFLSVRSDVLARVTEAIVASGMRAAIALGSADLSELPALPADWLVREFLPQVTLLRAAAVAVTHGGNNSVTEAMTYGVPLIVLPFSTDQFAGAEAIERCGFGVVLAPNEATVDELRVAIERAVHLASEPRAALDALSVDLRQNPGSARAFAAIAPSTS
jgi:MGT family glycosyltransferase